jgi:DNA-binding NtrC family response regulator
MDKDGQTPFRPLPLVVVVAEKDPIARATLATVLSYDGYRVFQAADLNAAISCIDSTNELAVLFADIDIPGWESLVQHAVKTTPDAIVIAMAAKNSIPGISNLKRCSIQACLHKPLSYDDVRQTLSVTVNTRQVA